MLMMRFLCVNTPLRRECQQSGCEAPQHVSQNCRCMIATFSDDWWIKKASNRQSRMRGEFLGRKIIFSNALRMNF
jgi:hypothetical protein